MKREVERDQFAKKRIERRRKIRKRRLTAFFIFFIITLLCVGAVLSLTVFFNIENITISGSNIYTAQEILEASELSKKNNLFATSRAKVETNIKGKLPFIESISFKRELPHTLKVTVKDEVEFACYKVEEDYYKVSSSGWVLEKVYEKPDDLIMIAADKVKCKVGSEIVFEDEKQNTLIFNIMDSLKAENIKVSEVDVSDILNIKLSVENRFDVHLGTSNNTNEKIKHLSGMLKELSEDKKGKIDLSMWTKENTKGTFTPQK